METKILTFLRAETRSQSSIYFPHGTNAYTGQESAHIDIQKSRLYFLNSVSGKEGRNSKD